MAAFLGGHSRPAEYVRHGLASAGDYINGKVGAGQARPWQRWLARYRRILEAVIVGIAVLVLIFWQDPTAAVAIWTAVLAVLAILVVELLCRPAVAPGPDAEAPATEPVAERAQPGASTSGSAPGGPPEELNPTIVLSPGRLAPDDWVGQRSARRLREAHHRRVVPRRAESHGSVP